MTPFHLLNETTSLFHDGMQMFLDTSNDPEFPGYPRVERLKGAADWEEFGTISVSFKFNNNRLEFDERANFRREDLRSKSLNNWLKFHEKKQTML